MIPDNMLNGPGFSERKRKPATLAGRSGFA
jgi:hypothetical protein